MHTPRLCIDGRAAQEVPTQGMVVQELIDQLVSAQGDENISSDWIEKKRTVLLTHPDQLFAGQLKRFDTKRKIGGSLFYHAWEKNFVETTNITAFHRFRPVDRLHPKLSCPTLSTVLPPKKSLPRSIPYDADHRFIVPSQKDFALLNKRYNIDASQIHTVLPAVRRYLSFVQEFQPTKEGWILFLVDPSQAPNLKKLSHVVTSRFPHVRHKVISLREQAPFEPPAWVKILENTKLCFYLTEQPFDWPHLALEAMYFGVPTVYLDKHHALSELIAEEALRLSQFLIEQPELSKIQQATQKAYAGLESREIFEPIAFAKQYRLIYDQLQ